jgi:CCR4-NOT transcription complex subunit 3
VIPSIAPAQLGRMPPGTKPPGTAGTMMPPPGLTSQTPPPGLGLGTGVGGAPSAGAGAISAPSSSDAQALPLGQSAHIKDRTLVPDDFALQLQLLEPSLRHLPAPSDSDRPRTYLPRNPYRTPAYFPSVPAPIFDDPLLFEQLSVDTLFFIFYFLQGTPHQYLAARELKKQSWRYHKNFLTWFQRHDDPKLTTDDFEQGTYVYFDYESGWSD